MRKTFAILMVLAATTLFTGCSDDSSSAEPLSDCMEGCINNGNTEAHCEPICANIDEK